MPGFKGPSWNNCTKGTATKRPQTQGRVDMEPGIDKGGNSNLKSYTNITNNNYSCARRNKKYIHRKGKSANLSLNSTNCIL